MEVQINIYKMNINDPLRVGAEGIKHDYAPKLDKKLRKYSDTGRYYPINQKGIVDEWAAVVDSQVTAANHQVQEEKMLKKNAQSDYMTHLRLVSARK